MCIRDSSLVNRFTMRFDNNAIIGTLPTVIFMILYVGLIIAVMVVAVALIIMRFYHGLLKDEGYLMFTLPVKPWQLEMCIRDRGCSPISSNEDPFLFKLI